MRDKVTKIVWSFFVSSHILTELNSTYIILILKVVGVNKISEFQPINLSNVVYKVISKILENIMK